ncbi:hypothetical protein RFI_31299 [Reticulomyxa filosa]|uniref:Reverse transcriptase domain-containing protein n=1 Tax=Reticulomyxa filosa TaxID=46433 RepID=X6LWU8_RETFI|nr:hypothetical protein RFI_31299 [Reticulomyxa filosa]|eukprot:ETO06099.1 hypothetical protein RFI_31299 [Reticulomyxa filosa]
MYPLHNELGELIHSDEGKCKLITSYYKKLFAHHTKTPILHKQNIMSSIKQFTKTHLQVLINEVDIAIKQLQNNKAAFLDCVNNELIKALSRRNNETITEFINCVSMKTQSMPAKLLITKMKSIDDHLTTLRIILYNYKYIKKQQLFISSIDLRKAFDKVWIPGLLYKLYECGIKGALFRLIKYIYEHGTLIVENNGIGNGQGFATSAPFFNLYINQLIASLKNCGNAIPIYNRKISCLLCADDIIIFGREKATINKAITKVKQYCKMWGLELNIKKYTVASINKNRKTIMDNIGIPNVVNEFKYLGIVFNTDNICWTTQINNLKLKLEKIKTKSIMHRFIGGHISIQLQRKFYLQMIRPTIESQAKTISINKHQMKKLEKIQHQILAKILLTYKTTNRCAIRLILGIPPTSARFDLLRLICYYRMIKKETGYICEDLIKSEHSYLTKTISEGIYHPNMYC